MKEMIAYCGLACHECGKDKDVQNCGHCADYPCDKLDWIFKVEPEAKRRLDQINTA